MQTLADALDYVAESERMLLAEVHASADMLHWSPDSRWTTAQIVRHLIRTEQTMWIMFQLAPRLDRIPPLRRAADRANALLWRAMGMRTVEHAKPTAARPELGRFHAPMFLRPGRGRRDTAEELLARRQSIRGRILGAVRAIDADSLHRVRWSHPLLGEYTMLEFTRFLGLHERHHLPQMRLLRELRSGT